METLGSRILEELNKNNLTQKELAKRVGTTEVTIGRYINDKREPNASMLFEISKVLGVTTDYLLGRSSNPKLSRKNELDIQKNLEEMKNNFNKGTLQMQLDGEELDDEVIQYILDNMEDALTIAKIKAKEKFTPKKYRWLND